MQRGAIVSLSLLLLLVFFPSLACAYLDEDIRVDCINKLNAKNKPELFRDYPELESIRSQTLVLLHIGEVDEKTPEYVNLIISIVDKFDEVYIKSKSNIPSVHIIAIDEGDEIREAIKKFDNYKATKDRGFSILGDLAIERLYKNEGMFLENIAVNEVTTRMKIEYYFKAAIAYKLGKDFSKQTKMDFEAKERKSAYDRDMRIADGKLSDCRAFLDKYVVGSNNFLENIYLYIEGKKAEKLSIEAIDIYKKHNEMKKIEEAEDILNKINFVNWNMMFDVSKFIGIIAIAYSGIIAFITFSFFRWRTEMTDADLGNYLLEGLW